MRFPSRGSGAIPLVAVLLALVAPFRVSADPDKARELLSTAGVRGGLVVHVGCGDGTLTASLRINDRFLVHGLDTDSAHVSRSRAHIRALGRYGPISVDRMLPGHLPYTDNLVNLVISENPDAVPMEEVLRVLSPGGVALVGGKKTVKPRPDQIDEWTHYLHDPSNNAVSHDTVVGPPRHFQWVGSPRWARHHDRMASLTALVSANGRLFYIFDEGPTSSIMLPPKRMLIARDAFSGVILWKRPVPTWHTYLWPLKSGPAYLPRRLVASDDRVYVTLGLHEPLSALDAATGETVRTYADTRATEDILFDKGLLLLVVNTDPKSVRYEPIHDNIGTARDRVAKEFPWDWSPRRVVALEAETGRVRWTSRHPVAPLSPAMDAGRVYFHDGTCVVCLDRKDGKLLWRQKPASVLEGAGRSFSTSTRKNIGSLGAALPTSFGPTLVVHDDVVLFTGGDGKLCGLSAVTGDALWTGACLSSGHYSPEDVLVVDGLVWTCEVAWPKDSGVIVGLDPRTGESKRRISCDTSIYFMHHRCHRSKATDRYLIPSRTGSEFIDVLAGGWQPHHWVRGGCLYGLLPCNGLLYTPPHSCACYMQSKLFGFCALSPARKTEPNPPPDDRRLMKGPAFDAMGLPAAKAVAAGDWPTYRHDGMRSGASGTIVRPELTRIWNRNPGGRPGPITISGGLLFVSSIDTHAVHALNAADGKIVWSFTAGGRVDSPPTIWHGRAIFGSADGHVYCLRASDGALVWRFRAAPVDRRMTAFEQVESVWPVPGSVLVLGDTVHCVAGRSMFLDGGIRYLRIDAATGQLVSENVLDHREPGSDRNLQAHVKGHSMPVALPDVLSTDGRSVYMRSQPFDPEGKRSLISHVSIDPAAKQGGTHLFSPTGFLDGTWWHRSYWVYGTGFAEGAGGWPQAGKWVPGGRILVVDDARVYGYGRKPEYFRWSTPLRYHLFATDKTPNYRGAAPRKKAGTQKASKRRRPPGPIIYAWSKEIPFHVRAMALAEDTLFVSGPPRLLDEADLFTQKPGSAASQARLSAQAASLDGSEGALLWAVSAKDGVRLAEYRLESPPAWDAMAVADGRLFLATEDGTIHCYGSK
jgi:outer membrane protein assembly factor BamB